jgi:RecA/RadA recombinase
MIQTKTIRKQLLAPQVKNRPSKLKDKDLLSTSSTCLNMALSGSPSGGIAKGTYLLAAGDSDSGKSVIARSILAEASINPEFKNYRLIYDDPEYGTALMDIRRLFPSLAKRVEERHSSFLDDFYDSTDEDIEDGRPFIKVLDSMDALLPREDAAKIKKQRKARREQEEAAGSYGTAKAKMNANRLRVLATTQIAKSKSILIIIAQLHDVVGGSPMLMGDNKKSVSGGKALKFYAHTVIWTGTKETIKTPGKVNGKFRELGIRAVVKVKKNRLTGRKRQVEIPIYHSAGVDDIGGMINYLIDEGHWKGTENQVIAPEFDFPKGSKEDLVEMIQFQGREDELQQIVAKTWRDIEDQCIVKRKNRYG